MSPRSWEATRSAGHKMPRGSRKHVLDLVSSVDARARLNHLVEPAGAVIGADAAWRPLSHSSPEECDVRRFCRDHPAAGIDLSPLSNWWAPETYRGPMWDLVTEARIEGRPAQILVEAKAHVSELDWHPKRPPTGASAQSAANYRRIAECLSDAESWFQRHVDRECRLSTESHYQLANRLATAHILASCGLHVVLVYLGFIGDTYFADALKDEGHWQRVMGAYLRDVVPLSWPGTRTADEKGGSVTFLVRSAAVMEVSR